MSCNVEGVSRSDRPIIVIGQLCSSSIQRLFFVVLVLLPTFFLKGEQSQRSYQRQYSDVPTYSTCLAPNSKKTTLAGNIVEHLAAEEQLQGQTIPIEFECCLYRTNV